MPTLFMHYRIVQLAFSSTPGAAYAKDAGILFADSGPIETVSLPQRVYK